MLFTRHRRGMYKGEGSRREKVLPVRGIEYFADIFIEIAGVLRLQV